MLQRLPFVVSAPLLLTSLALAQGSPPVCINGGPYAGECSGPATAVPIDGSASFDPDGTQVTFQWFEECAFGFVDDPTSPTANFIMDMSGVCQRSCFVVLRVTSGGQMVPCGTTVTVDDTTPPAVTCPPDVLVPVGGSIDPSVTGFATANDICLGGAVATTYADVPGPGANQITRTWSADDGCGVGTCDQILTLDEPPPPEGEADLDIKPTSCPNPINTANNGKLPVALVGAATFDVHDVDIASLQLSRHDGVGGSVSPVRTGYRDIASPFTGDLCDCHTLGGDGIIDLGMHFLVQDVVTTLQLDQVPNWTYLQLDLTGELVGGGSFTVSDCIRVQGN
jgi:hypothetical protein